MPTKRVLILANSIKKGARCVAGREVVAAAAGHRQLGGWLRPVSNREEGELLNNHYALAGGGSAAVLDIVDIELASHNDDPGQPENWLVAAGTTWRKIEALPPAELLQVEEHPGDLWTEEGGDAGRISVDAQAARDPQRSLVVVRPENLRIRLWREFNPWKNRTLRKTHAIFEYAGAEYSLSMTDPVFSRDHCSDHPGENEDPREFAPACAEDCLLCVSLTPPFNGFHYKVVATVLSLP